MSERIRNTTATVAELDEFRDEAISGLWEVAEFLNASVRDETGAEMVNKVFRAIMSLSTDYPAVALPDIEIMAAFRQSRLTAEREGFPRTSAQVLGYLQSLREFADKHGCIRIDTARY